MFLAGSEVCRLLLLALEQLSSVSGWVGSLQAFAACIRVTVQCFWVGRKFAGFCCLH